VTGNALPRYRRIWLSAWPVLTLLVFASVAVLRFLPGGFLRAAVAGPLLLTVPGSLALGAALPQRRRIEGPAFACYAFLLSAILTVLASLALYALGVLITATSTYLCLLSISAVIAICAQVRLLLGGSAGGHRAGRTGAGQDLDLSDAELRDAISPSAAKRAAGYAIAAAIVGICLLAAGLYGYDRLPRPAPVGYTWIAWTSPRIEKPVPISPQGTELHFQVLNSNSERSSYSLAADWLGSPSRPLAKPLAMTIGPQQTFRGALFIPPLPNGCLYRIVVILTARRQLNPLTKKPQTWSINVDVRDPVKSSKTCK